MRPRKLAPLLALPALLQACSWGSGSSWVSEPLAAEERASTGRGGTGQGRPLPVQARTLGARATGGEARESGEVAGGGRLVGVFRNTYYDFPTEGEADGKTPLVPLMSGTCAEIAKVPRAFHDAVCVQGSGALRRGGTVSFARRDCPCAEVCPRTGQRICFDTLDPAAYPHGRGAAGKPITPLRTIAADTNVLPMGTVVFVPELEGLTVAGGSEASDGCFVVEDRGLRVQGEHIDVFTGSPATTTLVNGRVPSNSGVHVFVEAPRCARLRPAP